MYSYVPSQIQSTEQRVEILVCGSVGESSITPWLIFFFMKSLIPSCATRVGMEFVVPASAAVRSAAHHSSAALPGTDAILLSSVDLIVAYH